MDGLMVWQELGWPLLKLVLLVAIGLGIANFIEALNWTHKVARLANPLIRMGHLSSISGASFSMAFFSGVSANSMLAEAYEQGTIDKKELICSNLFNSLPTYFLHLPTMFFITVPLIKGAAFIYVTITLLAAVLRTMVTLLAGRLMLPVRIYGGHHVQNVDGKSIQEALRLTWLSFRRRIKKIICFTVPVYTVIFFIQRGGGFALLEEFMATHISFLSWLHPQSLGIIVLHIAAEFTAGLAVAGALLDSGAMGYREVVLALLVGNVLSSPVRAVRHQLPYYTGIFPAKIAVELILYNQTFRLVSIVVVSFAYYAIF